MILKEQYNKILTIINRYKVVSAWKQLQPYNPWWSLLYELFFFSAQWLIWELSPIQSSSFEVLKKWLNCCRSARQTHGNALSFLPHKTNIIIYFTNNTQRIKACDKSLFKKTLPTHLTLSRKRSSWEEYKVQEFSLTKCL